MQAYADVNGDSGVANFEFGEGRIVVQFKNGSMYEYTDASAGTGAISQMIMLAQSGDGLNSYINRYVRQNYSRRII